MAKCKSCGAKISLFASVCDSCRAGLEKKQQDAREARLAASAAEDARKKEEQERQRRQEILDHKKALKDRMDIGEPIFAYESIYVGVDSFLLGDSITTKFDIVDIREMGLAGWEIVAVIPRTVGVGLENISIGSATGKTWGGGAGGNVAGVYVLMKKRIVSINAEDSDDELANYLDRHVENRTASQEALLSALDEITPPSRK